MSYQRLTDASEQYAGFMLGERVIQEILRLGFAQIHDYPDLIDTIFFKLTIDARRDIKEYLSTHVVDVRLNYPKDGDAMPLVSIINAAGQEDIPNDVVGDQFPFNEEHYETPDGYRVVGHAERSTFNIYCQASKDSNAVMWIYYVAKALLMVNRDTLINHGFIDTTYTGRDISFDSQRQGDWVYVRILSLTCMHFESVALAEKTYDAFVLDVVPPDSAIPYDGALNPLPLAPLSGSQSSTTDALAQVSTQAAAELLLGAELRVSGNGYFGGSVHIDGNLTSLNFSGSLTGNNTGDVTLGVPNGLSLDNQQLSLALASSVTTGALTSQDWNTFNNKAEVNAVRSFIAHCTVATQVGMCVHIIDPDLVAPALRDIPNVEPADITDGTKMPSAGIVISKNGDSYCTIVVSGDVGVFSTLLPGKAYFVGPDSYPAYTPLNISGTYYFQRVGLAISPTVILTASYPLTGRSTAS